MPIIPFIYRCGRAGKMRRSLETWWMRLLRASTASPMPLRGFTDPPCYLRLLLTTAVAITNACSLPATRYYPTHIRGGHVQRYRAPHREPIPFRDDQAVALRRRRLSDPVVAVRDPVQHAGLPERACRGCPTPHGAWSQRDIASAYL